ncbi:MAG: hypothetical protein J6T96_06820 [Bacteroidales bacterium]|nr:hypothetical protein [Bacteroidales bacterium]
MFAYINDLTAYLIIKEVAAAINSDSANKRSAESDRTQSLTTRDILQSIIEAIPDVAKLIKETRAAQQPAIQPGKAVGIQKIPGRLVKKIIWDFLVDNLTLDQLGTLGSWLKENEGKADEKATAEDAAEKAGTEDAAKTADEKEE